MVPIQELAASVLTDLLFEEPGVGRCLVAPDGTVVRANAEWLRSTGFSLDDVLGAAIIDLFPDTGAMHARARAGHRVDVPRHAQRIHGRETWWEGSIAAVPMEAGTGLLITAREVTPGLVRAGMAAPGDAERALSEAHARLRAHVETTPLALVEWDSSYRLKSFSRRAEELFGWSAEEVIGRGIDEIPWIPEDDWPSVRAVMGEMSSGRRVTTMNANRNVRKDGSVIYCEWYNSTLQDDAGRLASVLSLVLDVTARKRAEDALRDEEKKYRSLFENSLDAVYLTRQDGTILDANRAACQMHAMSLEEVKHCGRAGLVVNDDRHAAALKTRGATGQVRAEMTDLRKDGSRFPVEVESVVVDPTVPDATAFVIARDISERKRAEEALRGSEERFRALVTATSDVVYRMSPDWSEMRQLRGGGVIADVDAPITDWAQRYVHPEDERLLRAVIDEAVRTASTFELEHRVLRPDGSLGWTFSRAVPLQDASGAIIEWFGMASDVTERKRAEEGLREAVQRYERQVRLFDGVASTTPDFVYLFDLQGRHLYANRRLLEVWGMQLQDVIGKTFRELGYEQWHHDMHMREIAQVIESKRPIKGEVPFKAPRTGVFGVYEYIFTPVVGPDGEVEIVAGTTRDVTERKRAEDAVREADRRKSEFLAVLSHELRNPLAPIRNSIYLLERAPPGSEQATRARDVVRRQTEHLTRLVDDLLDVTRISRGKITLQLTRLDLREIVRKTTDDVRSVFAQAGVELRVDHVLGPVWIDADATRISQVLGNLLHNSVKFTLAGGTVTVSIATRGGCAELSVRDTGIGMDPAQIDRMFEAFAQADQTLARTDGGLGLGLALVKGLVELHEGTVEARTEGLGRGAEFLVRFRLADGGPGAKPPDLDELMAALTHDR